MCLFLVVDPGRIDEVVNPKSTNGACYLTTDQTNYIVAPRQELQPSLISKFMHMDVDIQAQEGMIVTPSRVVCAFIRTTAASSLA